MSHVMPLLLAGGEGSRLGSFGPKALVRVLPDKTLLSFWLSKVCQRGIIMTSKASEKALREASPSFIEILVQGELPTEGGQEGETAPSGNGDLYRLLFESGALDRLENEGVKVVSMTPIDNPLADPLEKELLEPILEGVADLVVKAFPIEGEEMVGRLVFEEGVVKVVEYSEEQVSKRPANSLGYSGIAAFSLSFLKKAAKVDLPLHQAFKKGRIKKEKFIFDAFHIADKPFVLIEDKSKFFFPIKTKEDLEKFIVYDTIEG